jgi:hypothetical protein
LSPTVLTVIGSDLVADGNEAYQYNFKIRDQYGNLADHGTYMIEYIDSVRDIQIDDVFPYATMGPGNAIIPV